MKKLALIASAIVFTVTFASAADTTIKGYVSDSLCGAKGANEAHAECARKCMAKGAKTIIVTDGDQKILTVANPDALKGHEGHHVAVTGSLDNDTIRITNVSML